VRLEPSTLRQIQVRRNTSWFLLLCMPLLLHTVRHVFNREKCEWP